MGVQEWNVTEPYLEIPCSLGEGPHYHAPSHTLRFLDINNRQLHLLDLRAGPSSLRTISTSMPVGVTADLAGVDPTHEILCGAKDGVTRFDLRTGQHAYVARFWQNVTDEQEQQDRTRRFRANDGGVDSRGRFWVEAFVDPTVGEPDRDGCLMRLDGFDGRKGKLTTVLEGVTIPNGISWSEDDGTMFFTDSPRQEVGRFEYVAGTGEVGERKVLYRHEVEGEFPDGHVMDVEGNIWHAVYGGAKVIRISPQGEVTGVVRLPVKNVTCPVFVGTELYITTAKDEDGGKWAGSLFRCEVGVEGVKKREVCFE
ncbi:uncharacterized protein HMPREF1541_06666 [Cyphellophora europaea CBS 101466]|uniref:SMP-30/Gluconolactonase/LRE-like region domain-containing protein n=1 Tax=Cyphellophora europaea (strain CBS 101466) TaxID=1220924 RepID=W2RSC8_CYPE1|nr:uncharacterized protein HMPREF1541_06666 [Cyphellophora europaea CBS 101466]ETN38629.1 hypothetical protein HMPREF1541_06666 [Cyphellophora europaea CBS 101466]